MTGCPQVDDHDRGGRRGRRTTAGSREDPEQLASALETPQEAWASSGRSPGNKSCSRVEIDPGRHPRENRASRPPPLSPVALVQIAVFTSRCRAGRTEGQKRSQRTLAVEPLLIERRTPNDGSSTHSASRQKKDSRYELEINEASASAILGHQEL